jgi:excisionase family DNA binding protein
MSSEIAVRMAHIFSTTEELQNFITKAIASGMDKILPLIEAKTIKIEKEIFNLVEAAQYLNMSKHTLRKKIDEGKITFIQDERVLQFRKKHLNDYLDQHTLNTRK